MIENLTNQELASGVLTVVILLSLLLGAARSQGVRKLLTGIFAWLLIVFVIIIGYAFRSELDYGYQRVMAVLIPFSSWTNETGELVIARAPDGHFYLDAIINGAKIKFLIDTGASDIALTKNDAAKLGIDIARLKFTRKYSTANGISYAAPITLQTVTIGNKTFRNIKGHVGQGDLDISLFGMSAIESFKGFKLDRDMLILSY